MTLTDAGVLFALVDKKQEAHSRCRSTLPQISKPLLTPWPCFTEAMYFAYKTGGWERQRLLWELLNSGLLRIYFTSEEETLSMQELMLKYRDTPMDIADAALVSAAEALGHSRIFTLDSDFYVYLRNGKEPFEVVP